MRSTFFVHTRLLDMIVVRIARFVNAILAQVYCASSFFKRIRPAKTGLAAMFGKRENRQTKECKNRRIIASIATLHRLYSKKTLIESEQRIVDLMDTKITVTDEVFDD